MGGRTARDSSRVARVPSRSELCNGVPVVSMKAGFTGDRGKVHSVDSRTVIVAFRSRSGYLIPEPHRLKELRVED